MSLFSLTLMWINKNKNGSSNWTFCSGFFLSECNLDAFHWLFVYNPHIIIIEWEVRFYDRKSDCYIKKFSSCSKILLTEKGNDWIVFETVLWLKFYGSKDLSQNLLEGAWSLILQQTKMLLFLRFKGTEEFVSKRLRKSHFM